MVRLWFWTAIGLLASGKAQSQDGGFERLEFSFRPPEAAVSLEIFAPHETFVVEKNCVASTMDVFNSPLHMGSNTLEVGLRIALPQRIPAQSQWYSRYTCQRPGERP